jgi:hypothetical protein
MVLRPKLQVIKIRFPNLFSVTCTTSEKKKGAGLFFTQIKEACPFF